MNTSEALNVPDCSDKPADLDRPLRIIAESSAFVVDQMRSYLRQKLTPRRQDRRISFEEPQFSPQPAEVIRDKQILSDNPNKEASVPHWSSLMETAHVAGLQKTPQGLYGCR